MDQIVIGLVQTTKNDHGYKLDLITSPVTGVKTVTGLQGSPYYESELNEILYDMVSFRGRFNITFQIDSWFMNYGRILNSLPGVQTDIFWFSNPTHTWIWNNNVGPAGALYNRISAFPDLEESRIEIVTPYDCSIKTALDNVRQSDFIESLFGFGYDTWILYFITLSIIAGLLNAHMRMNNHKSKGPIGSPIWTIFSFIAKQPAIIDINWMSRAISFILAIFVLFVGICHFENVIKSDKMTIYVPHVYKSYRELIGNNVTIYSSGINNYGLIYRYGNFSPVHREIYWKIMNHGNKLPPKYRQKYALGDDPYIEISNYSDNSVGLLRTFEAHRTIIPSLCDMLEENNRTDTCFYRTVSEEDKIIDAGMGHVYSQKFKNNPIFDKFMHIYGISYAMGLTYFKSRHRYVKIPKMSTSECRSESQYPVTHEPEYSPFELVNYKYALISLLIPISIAITVLIFEMLYSRYRDKKCKISDIGFLSTHHYYPSMYWTTLLEPILEEADIAPDI